MTCRSSASAQNLLEGWKTVNVWPNRSRPRRTCSGERQKEIPKGLREQWMSTSELRTVGSAMWVWYVKICESSQAPGWFEKEFKSIKADDQLTSRLYKTGQQHEDSDLEDLTRTLQTVGKAHRSSAQSRLVKPQTRRIERACRQRAHSRAPDRVTAINAIQSNERDALGNKRSR
ncbi:hypothetical protein OF83DRAFT_1083966 [Amylostereum chailletii]|nr:hypothetical protein OF83DRAFT_1083966 [Amylostereum chailletii]